MDWKVNLDKKKQLLEAKYFFRIVCLFFFLFFGVRMVFYYGCIERKNAQDTKVYKSLSCLVMKLQYVFYI